MSDPRCTHCGRSLLGYSWNSVDDDGTSHDGYICTANHKELGGDVAFFIFKLVDDEWVLMERKS